MREKMDCGAGGGFFNIDFPGIGMVTAEDDGEHDEAIDVQRPRLGILSNIHEL
jgi:hypothetical protein